MGYIFNFNTILLIFKANCLAAIIRNQTSELRRIILKLVVGQSAGQHEMLDQLTFLALSSSVYSTLSSCLEIISNSTCSTCNLLLTVFSALAFDWGLAGVLFLDHSVCFFDVICES